MNKVKIGIIAGSGVANQLGKGIELYTPETPYGFTSAPLMKMNIKDQEVFVMKRHGNYHQFNPTNVNYRANIYALKEVGVTHLISTGACGSLVGYIKPTELVICDQIIDRTTQRKRTFYEDLAVHVPMSKPICPTMRQWLLDSCKRAGNDGEYFVPNTPNLNTLYKIHDNGVYITIEGPQFSTRSESLSYNMMLADVIGMTACPEAALCKELELPYALIAIPTDSDTHSDTNGDMNKTILENLKQGSINAVNLIISAISNLDYLKNNTCEAHDALKDAVWTDLKYVNANSPSLKALNLCKLAKS